MSGGGWEASGGERRARSAKRWVEKVEKEGGLWRWTRVAKRWAKEEDGGWWEGGWRRGKATKEKED